MDLGDGGRERGARRGPSQVGRGERSEGAPPNGDPHRPWRRNLRFLRPKMRTLEKISTRLPLQSPRFLLGLLRLLLADGRSQCCSRACRFWRIKPLAMAAAMVARGMGPGREGTEGRGAGDAGEGRGGADGGSPSRKSGEEARGGEERSRGAQSRLGPIALWAEHGAGRADAPGTRRGEPPEPRSRRPPPGRVRAGSGAGAVGAAAHPAPPKPCRGPPPPLAPPASLSRLPAGRSSPPTSRARDGGQVPAGGRRGRPSRADSEGLSAGLELSPGRCRRRRRPLAGSAGDCQVLWKSASGESNLLPGDL